MVGRDIRHFEAEGLDESLRPALVERSHDAPGEPVKLVACGFDAAPTNLVELAVVSKRAEHLERLIEHLGGFLVQLVAERVLLDGAGGVPGGQGAGEARYDAAGATGPGRHVGFGLVHAHGTVHRELVVGVLGDEEAGNLQRGRLVIAVADDQLQRLLRVPLEADRVGAARGVAEAGCRLARLQVPDDEAARVRRRRRTRGAHGRTASGEDVAEAGAPAHAGDEADAPLPVAGVNQLGFSGVGQITNGDLAVDAGHAEHVGFGVEAHLLQRRVAHLGLRDHLGPVAFHQRGAVDNIDVTSGASQGHQAVVAAGSHPRQRRQIALEEVQVGGVVGREVADAGAVPEAFIAPEGVVLAAEEVLVAEAAEAAVHLELRGEGVAAALRLLPDLETQERQRPIVGLQARGPAAAKFVVARRRQNAAGGRRKGREYTEALHGLQHGIANTGAVCSHSRWWAPETRRRNDFTADAPSVSYCRGSLPRPVSHAPAARL
ncbi:pentachlorophenol 4-monooxygenase [Babesia caballi]|uniref:Pentachlorophenol 4-monooxygenase n=1 Tax=Babesia caballi TaxID=5871 RepID=A0AAV4LT99_BABCB|nr:pentachlorophenol 4-monooxygenase [Babesia caballi]